MSFFNKFRKKEAQKNLHEDILESICDILNTKASFGNYDKTFGMNTYIYLSYNNRVTKQIIEDIENCLKKYETRIQITAIKSVPGKDLFSLGFLIQCKIQKNTHSFQLAFQTERRKFESEEGL
ncbi:MAG TPA: GPW/gp25 family protein [Rhabdochlamydiaceae bacterium]|nr:GPW/gp25 family protein [Rhabdochlamydiaceae bacterium]